VFGTDPDGRESGRVLNSVRAVMDHMNVSTSRILTKYQDLDSYPNITQFELNPAEKIRMEFLLTIQKLVMCQLEMIQYLTLSDLPLLYYVFLIAYGGDLPNVLAGDLFQTTVGSFADSQGRAHIPGDKGKHTRSDPGKCVELRLLWLVFSLTYRNHSVRAGNYHCP
jgi:hypothetical protein